ncbi:putative natural product biosynthesis protein [Pseudomonas sp. NW5]|uniref:putative natural product biosynthesis protein n=1 Tax=Pseudomonas sp. NW5 TaxID=2934934 RepID=UPI002021B050|nr:putative natural product biosynthesis protein [Pseudomonas sp. NW5]MCL7462918.1 putative natural product biosynthesis protein [Pseudomonas sp. NW5]
MEKLARLPAKRPAIQPFPDYPGNAHSFVQLDARLMPYWHALFDICPSLLKLDACEGIELFRHFMRWAYRQRVPLNWTFHLQACRWLLASEYRDRLTEEQVEALMIASAARWAVSDDTQALGVVLSCRDSGVRVFEWKEHVASRLPLAVEQEELPPTPWDIAWCPLASRGSTGFRRWLPL